MPASEKVGAVSDPPTVTPVIDGSPVGAPTVLVASRCRPTGSVSVTTIDSARPPTLVSVSATCTRPPGSGLTTCATPDPANDGIIRRLAGSLELPGELRFDGVDGPLSTQPQVAAAENLPSTQVEPRVSVTKYVSLALAKRSGRLIVPPLARLVPPAWPVPVIV